MRDWEKIIFTDEEEAMEFYRRGIFPPTFSVAIYWQNDDFKRALFNHARLKSGKRLLLVSENNDACGLPQMAREIVGPDGDVVSLDLMEDARRRHEWPIYTEACAAYDEGEFDAAVATTTHHVDDLKKEVKALCRVIRPGGRAVFSDNGPGRTFFELAQHDAHLEHMAQLLATYMGVRFGFGDTTEEAYEAVRKWGTKYAEEEVEEAVQDLLTGVERFRWKGLWLVSGEKP